MTPEVEEALDYAGNGAGAKGVHFKMWDDDGNLYYEGRLAFPGWDKGETPDEEIIASPLFQFGAGFAGCTRIEYTGRKSWAIG